MVWKTDDELDVLVRRLEEWIPQSMAQAVVPGLSVTLVRDAELAWHRGFGVCSAESEQSVTTDTVFEAASLSKPVFAYLALKLCEAGELDLDKPLVEYLAEEEKSGEKLFDHVLNEPRLQVVTTRHVLSHTPGFPNWAPKGEPLKIRLSPGERFSYSGEGYVFLQRVLEQITGQSVAVTIRENVLERLGMHSSHFTWDEGVGLPVAQGHNEMGQVVKKRSWPEMVSAASLHCTPDDYARFLIAVMRPSQEDRYHLSPDWVSEMLSPQVKVNDNQPWHNDWPQSTVNLNDSVSWGLGWGLQHHEEHDSFWHWGDNGSFKAFAAGLRDRGLAAVATANSANGDKLWRKLFQEVLGGEYPGLEWLGVAA